MANRSTARRPPAPTHEQTRYDLGALEQRVYGTEQMIRDLGTQTTNQIKELASAWTSAIADVNAKLDRQQTFSIQSSRTDWSKILAVAFGAVGTVTTVFVVIGSMAKGPIDDRLKMLADITVPRAELQTNFVEMQRRMNQVEGVAGRAATRTESQRAQDKLRDDVNAIRADLVTRSEHKTHWDEIAERQTALSNRINMMQHEFGSNYTIGDQVKSLQKQIDDMRIAEVAAVKGAPAR